MKYIPNGRQTGISKTDSDGLHPLKIFIGQQGIRTVYSTGLDSEVEREVIVKERMTEH